MHRTIFDTPLVNTGLRALSRGFLRATGWRIEGSLPPGAAKSVLIAAPHTSNWDLPYTLMVAFDLRLHIYWMGKASIFRWPFGGLMRSWGGIPIQRHLSLNMVEQAIQGFRDNREFILVLSPEGTRKKVERWKMGFYHIALGAGVPIVPGALDFANRRVVIGAPFQPTGDAEADLQALLAFFRPYVPKKPEYAFYGD